MDIKNLSIRFWMQSGIIALGALLYVVLVSFSWIDTRNHLYEDTRYHLQTDLSHLTYQLSENIITGNFGEVDNLLSMYQFNNRFTDLLIVNKKTGELWKTSGISLQEASDYQFTRDEDAILASFSTSTRPVFTFNDSTHIYTAYYSLPLDDWHTTLERNGVLIAHYDTSDRLEQLTQSLLERSLVSGIIIFIFVILLLNLYRVLIQKPIANTIASIQQFSKTHEPIVSKQATSREWVQLSSALRDMSMEMIDSIDAMNIEKKERIRSFNVLETIFESIPDLFFLIDKEFRIIDYRAQKNNLYVPPEVFLGKRMDEVLPKEIGNLFQQCYLSVSKHGDLTTFEYELSLDEYPRYFEARTAKVPESEDIVTIIRDGTQRKQAEDTIARQAFYDALTNLPNRYLALERVQRGIADAERHQNRMAILFMDLDDFKKINDSLGHSTGDDLLAAVANRINDSTRNNDTVARLGGDEFLLIINDLQDLSPVQTIALAVHRKLMTPFDLEHHQVEVSASIGISVYPDNSLDANELLMQADLAMYHAKANGKGQTAFYNDEMNRRMQRQVSVETQLKKAMLSDEFEVFYQPQFSLTDKSIIGAEALIRWNNAELGSVSPSEFIPISEHNGLINDIGRFVIERALNQSQVWRKTISADFRISVNLSPTQMRDLSLVLFIQNMMINTDTTGSALDVEITEGVLLSSHPTVKEVLKRIEQMEISLSMDDFGTGYSSLSYLLKHSFNYVKIDRSFVQAMPTNKQSQVLVKASISLAHGLGLKVVAEGVEDLASAQLLKQYGCDLVQGFYFGKPVDANTFELLWADKAAIEAMLSF